MNTTCPCFEMEEIPEVDFLKEACNVYRTEEHIVKQKLFISESDDMYIALTGSNDFYYARTPKRDREYNKIFAHRGERIDGKRVKVSVYTREYIE